MDTISRILETSLVQINTGKSKKALENLAKAEKLYEKAKLPDYMCSILMLKGRALLGGPGRVPETNRICRASLSG
jgi:hypothetical protein